MAVLAITAANVRHISGPVEERAVAGEAFIAGAYVYKKSTDDNWYKAECDVASTESAGSNGHGMALFTADGVGAKGSVALPGSTVRIGAGVVGTCYAIARTAGSITPIADMLSTDKVTPIGVVNATSQIKLFDGYTGAVV